jgi:hypothetical protein
MKKSLDELFENWLLVASKVSFVMGDDNNAKSFIKTCQVDTIPTFAISVDLESGLENMSINPPILLDMPRRHSATPESIAVANPTK